MNHLVCILWATYDRSVGNSKPSALSIAAGSAHCSHWAGFMTSPRLGYSARSTVTGSAPSKITATRLMTLLNGGIWSAWN